LPLEIATNPRFFRALRIGYDDSRDNSNYMP